MQKADANRNILSEHITVMVIAYHAEEDNITGLTYRISSRAGKISGQATIATGNL